MSEPFWIMDVSVSLTEELDLTEEFVMDEEAGDFILYDLLGRAVQNIARRQSFAVVYSTARQTFTMS